MTVWREPPDETEEYPGVVVCDNRVTGSMTLGRSRLPLWAFVGWLPRGGWAEVKDNWDDFYGWDGDKMAGLLVDIFEQRGEFARLILILADEERRESEATDKALADAGGGVVRIALTPDGEGLTLPEPWWAQPASRARVAGQLRRCLASLTDETDAIVPAGTHGPRDARSSEERAHASDDDAKHQPSPNSDTTLR